MASASTACAAAATACVAPAASSRRRATATPPLLNCSGHGSCFVGAGDAACHCDVGWAGPACAEPSCGACGEHGRCERGLCVCAVDWAGDDCSVGSACPEGCHGHGRVFLIETADIFAQSVGDTLTTISLRLIVDSWGTDRFLSTRLNFLGWASNQSANKAVRDVTPSGQCLKESNGAGHRGSSSLASSAAGASWRGARRDGHDQQCRWQSRRLACSSTGVRVCGCGAGQRARQEQKQIGAMAQPRPAARDGWMRAR